MSGCVFSSGGEVVTDSGKIQLGERNRLDAQTVVFGGASSRLEMLSVPVSSATRKEAPMV